jgi:hypothetical protein
MNVYVNVSCASTNIEQAHHKQLKIQYLYSTTQQDGGGEGTTTGVTHLICKFKNVNGKMKVLIRIFDQNSPIVIKIAARWLFGRCDLLLAFRSGMECDWWGKFMMRVGWVDVLVHVPVRP